ncbi:MAG: hypothetical protein NT080_07615 [Spirochaetes bacterium]|nr:hypothetical protein [Spirochaetota bacterium]
MKRTTRINHPERLLVAAVLSLLLPFAAAAQDAPQGPDDDPFSPGAFDAAAGSVPGGEDAGSGPVTAGTELQAGGTVIASMNAATMSGFTGYTAQAGLSGKIFAKASSPDFGALYIAYNTRYSFAQGESGDVAFPAPPVDYTQPSFTLSELHYGFDIGKRVFFRAGNQLIAWGATRIWSPVDFINLERADPFQPVDLRSGKPGLRVHVPFPRANLFAFADFSGTVDSGAVKDVVRWTNVAFRADAAIAGAEFGLSAYGGLEAQARLGFDVSGRVLGFTLYGETAFAPEYDTFNGYLAASLGFSRALDELKRWTLSGEGYYDSRGSDRTGAYDAGTYLPLYSGEAYAYLALTADELFSNKLSTMFSGIANLSDASFSLKLSENADLSGSPPFTVSLSYNGGGEEKEFTSLAGNNSLGLTIQSRMEF